MNLDRKPRVGITHGDINGIGYEVIMKALEDNRILELCTPVIYGSAKIAAYYRKALGIPGIPLNQIREAADARDEQYNIINVVGEDTKVEPGVAGRAAGEAALAALTRAAADLKNGDIDLVVTAPINKHTIHSEAFPFPGHTEFFASEAGEGTEPLMIMCVPDGLRLALVTTHLPLSQVSAAITKESVFNKICNFNDSLRRDFGIGRPRIAVLSLNPHAGEEGLLGSEETDAIIPAIKDAQAKHINCFGPYASDGFFGNNLYKKFDGVLAMYHDQGLTPFKTLAMDSGVNFTAGLPFVRTSPDHGTAFDIAGRGEASPDSLRQAIYLGIDICRNRDKFDEAHANPLRKQYVEKNKSDNVVLDLSKSDDA